MSKHQFIGLNFDDTDRELQEGDYVHSLNLIPPKGGVATSAQRENIKGNVLIHNSLPAGENVCIGSYEDKTGNRLIFFIWNSNGKHSIYKYEYKTDSIQKIFEWSGLKFEKGKKITGIDLVQDILYWTDGGGLRQLNIKRVPSTANLDERGISLYKTPPTKPPVVERVLDEDFAFNYISDKNYQFAYRYTYLDNEVSLLSPYSKLSPAETLSEFYGGENGAPNKIIINVANEALIIDKIKSIDFVYRENNDGSFYLFKSVKTGFSTEMSISFYNREINSLLDDEYAYTQSENIPFGSSNLTVFENRLFTTKDSQGYYVDESLIDFNVSVKAKKLYEGDIHPDFTNDARTRRSRTGGPDIPADVVITDTTTRFLKNCGLYNVALAFYDEHNRHSSATNLKAITVPYVPFISTRGGYTLDLGKRHYLEAQLGGTPPSWAKRFQVLLSREQYYSAYAQYPVNLMFYIRPEDEDISVQEWEYAQGGNVYLADRPTAENQLKFNYIHLQIPTNSPFIPDRECFVRILSGETDIIEPVIDVVGDKIVVNSFDIEHFDSWRSSIIIEVFKINKVKDDYVFEVGEVLDLIENSDGSKSFPSQAIDIYGDTFTIITNSPPLWFKYGDIPDELSQNLTNRASNAGQTAPFFVPVQSAISRFESPSNHYSGEIDTTDTEGASSPLTTSSRGRSFTGTRVPMLKKNETFTLDYSKIASDIGRVNLINVENVITNDPTVILFSDTYVQNSLVNGLNSFSPLNEHPLPYEGGRIRKLIPVGNVLLAIQERETTSIYINEGFINTGDGQQFLSKTANVVGDDRTLRGGYGTINPESVDTYNGNAFFYDMNKGEVLRYAENGLTQLAATFKAKEYFTKKSRERLKYKDTAKVYGQYHPYLEMYILTFAPVGEFPGETIGFSERHKRWITFFSFIPENYGRLNTELFSFKSGNLWAHDRTENRNSFYGTNNNSEIAYICNSVATHEKMFENISLDSSEPWDVDMSNEEQFTDLVKGEFEMFGGNWYTHLRRDKNTPAEVLNENEIGLLHGWPIEGRTLKVKLMNNSTSPIVLDSVYIGYKVKSGQLINER